MGQDRHRVGGGKAAGTATGLFLQRIGMRGAVGAEEIAWVARGRGAAERQPVFFAFGDRQAVVMRTDAAREDVVAVQDQVVGGDGGCDIGTLGGVGHTFFGGDMLHHHAEFRQALAQRVQHGVDEHRLAVEDVNLGCRDLAMGAERQADFGHFLQHLHHLGQIPHAAIRVGGGTGGIEFDRLDQTGGGGLRHIGG